MGRARRGARRKQMPPATTHNSKLQVLLLLLHLVSLQLFVLPQRILLPLSPSLPPAPRNPLQLLEFPLPQPLQALSVNPFGPLGRLLEHFRLRDVFLVPLL